MSRTPRVIHTAQALVDEVVHVPALPRRGGNVMASSTTREVGGAVTILRAAARSGADAVHAGSVGTGPNGGLVREALAADGIALTSPEVPDQDTAVCVVLVEPSAERTFVTAMGAERVISPESLQTSEPVDGDLVCVSGYSLLEPTRDPLLAWLRGLPAGVRVVLDPGAAFEGLDAALQREVLALTDVWSSNAEEAEALVGAPADTDMAELAAQVAGLLRAGCLVVVRDGDKGCAVGDGGAVVAVPGFPQDPVDTNGAGDTHTGVLCAELAAGADPVAAARRANAAGALKVTRHGPATVPTAAEVGAFLAGR